MRHAMDPKVCERYREERGRTGLTPIAFARAGGLCNANIYNIENGKHCPSWKSLAVLAQLGGDVHYVLTGERKSQTRTQKFFNRVHLKVNARRKEPRPVSASAELFNTAAGLYMAILSQPWSVAT